MTAHTGQSVPDVDDGASGGGAARLAAAAAAADCWFNGGWSRLRPQRRGLPVWKISDTMRRPNSERCSTRTRKTPARGVVLSTTSCLMIRQPPPAQPVPARPLFYAGGPPWGPSPALRASPRGVSRRASTRGRTQLARERRVRARGHSRGRGPPACQGSPERRPAHCFRHCWRPTSQVGRTVVTVTICLYGTLAHFVAPVPAMHSHGAPRRGVLVSIPIAAILNEKGVARAYDRRI